MTNNRCGEMMAALKPPHRQVALTAKISCNMIETAAAVVRL